MNPGELDTLVAVRRATETRAANGSVVKTWADIASIWMSSPEPVSGREAVTAQQLQVVASSKANVRHGSGITVKDRIVDGSITYEVTRVFNVGTRRSWQELWLTEAKP
jgi:head-tail adaptor